MNNNKIHGILATKGGNNVIIQHKIMKFIRNCEGTYSSSSFKCSPVRIIQKNLINSYGEVVEKTRFFKL
jgi:hypothetical protein